MFRSQKIINKYINQRNKSYAEIVRNKIYNMHAENRGKLFGMLQHTKNNLPKNLYYNVLYQLL